MVIFPAVNGSIQGALQAASRMTNTSRDTRSFVQQPNVASIPSKGYLARRAIAQFIAIIFVLLIYSYPSLKAKADFGAVNLPPIFAPDLSLYLNLSSVKTISPGQVLNPYYLLPVPSSGTAYLKFRLGPILFHAWNKLLARQLWLAMFTWNLFWWALLCAITLWLFERFLPANSLPIGIAGLGLLMLVNIGMLRPLIAAWLHLPSLFGFQGVALPFMRAFSPQIPIPFLLAYLGLQIDALRQRRLHSWIVMAVLQLLALSAFPYATLMMAGISFLSVVWLLFSPRSPRGIWRFAFAYSAACAIADGLFLKRGSMNIYARHSALIHLQPSLLAHLVGGIWLILFLLTTATALSKSLPEEVKWPLVGLGAINMLLMLGDAVVPATVLLLSSHAAYFAQTTSALLLTFLASATLVRSAEKSPRPNKVRLAIVLVLLLLALNGAFLSLGTYRAFFTSNREQVELATLMNSLPPLSTGQLFVARSLSVDDACGWIALLARGPVLYCTDAETMLTPQDNENINRFREAIYLYLTGEDSGRLQQILAGPNSTGPMYRLGFWAEASSLSREEQHAGVAAVQESVIPRLQRVERHDPDVSRFFRQFQRITVIDDQQNPTFVPVRLGSFLKFDGEQHLGHWVALSYVPE